MSGLRMLYDQSQKQKKTRTAPKTLMDAKKPIVIRKMSFPYASSGNDGFMFNCFTPDLAFDFICVHLRCYRSFAFSFASKSFDFKVRQQDVSCYLIYIFFTQFST